jgi:hypothetical protein
MLPNTACGVHPTLRHSFASQGPLVVRAAFLGHLSDFGGIHAPTRRR